MSISYCETECLTQDARMKIMQRFCISFPLWGWPRRRNGMRQVDVKMPEMDEQECSVEAFLEVNTLCKDTFGFVAFRIESGIQNRSNYETFAYITLSPLEISPGGFLLDQCCTSMAVWEGREDVSVVASTSNQCNQIRFALCNAECQVVHSTYMPMSTTKLQRRNRRRKSSQAWIAGLLAVEQLL